ncbi:MAG TPA: hypothetical protein VI757_12290 [Bacteroidia bacterium]|nr:hypothetical protein [Bacteroidia bacterium]
MGEKRSALIRSTSDLTYTVTVSGITGAANSSYTYSAIVIRP